MHRHKSNLPHRARVLGFFLFWLLAGHPQAAAQSRPGATAEQKTLQRFESIRTQPLELYAFLREMPKGGDLHLHLTGTVYAESMIEWAAPSQSLRQHKRILPCSLRQRQPGDARQSGVYGRRALPPDGGCLVHAECAAFRTERTRSILRCVCQIRSGGRQPVRRYGGGGRPPRRVRTGQLSGSDAHAR